MGPPAQVLALHDVSLYRAPSPNSRTFHKGVSSPPTVGLFPKASRPHQHLLLSVTDILVGVKLYLNTAFIGIFLMTNDVESVLLAVQMSLVKCLFKYFSHFENWTL